MSKDKKVSIRATEEEKERYREIAKKGGFSNVSSMIKFLIHKEEQRQNGK